MRNALTLMTTLLIGSAAEGQIRDQIIVYATVLEPGNDAVRVCQYDRKLERAFGNRGDSVHTSRGPALSLSRAHLGDIGKGKGKDHRRRPSGGRETGN